MKVIASIVMPLVIVGASYQANSNGINLWLFLSFFVLGYSTGLTMILVSVPLVLFTLSLLLAGATAITISFSQNLPAVASGLCLASVVLFLHYFVWLRSSGNE
jgi:hypothetical protein